MDEDGANNSNRDVDKLLGDLAARRQRQVESASEARSRFDFLLDIRTSEVSYNIEPAGLPYTPNKFKDFVVHLTKMYGISFHIPKTPYTPSDVRLDPFDLEERFDNVLHPHHVREFLDFVFQTTMLAFVDGRLPLRRGGAAASDFVTIRRIALDEQSIHVAVSGESQYAEIIAQEVAALLWATTGIEKRWDSIEPYVSLVRYATSTKVDLGVPLETFLNPRVSEFIQEQIVEEEKGNYGRQMSAHSNRSESIPAGPKVITYNAQNLYLRVHIFDTTNARYEEVKLDFDVLAKNERGTGRFAVDSQLPYDAHMSLLESLKAHLEEQ